MNKLSDLTQVPVFMINPTSPQTKTHQSMRIYPPSEALADKLLRTYQEKNVTHVTFLHPKEADLDLLVQLKKKSKNSIYFMEASYESGSSQMLLANIKSATARMNIVRSKTQAVLILDNFKMVRHLVNMIRGAASELNLVISGNQQWRSPALVSPKEEALEGAVFVDFIGSYAKLPSGLQVPMPESEFFTTAEAASRLDYQIIGHRIGTFATQSISRFWSRQRIASELQKLKNSWDNYFPENELAFSSTRESSWPSYLFKVQGESIQLTPDSPQSAL